MHTYMPIYITKGAIYSLFLKVEMSIQKISPVISNAMDVGSSLSESEKILSTYLELDKQAKVNKMSYYYGYGFVNMIFLYFQ